MATLDTHSCTLAQTMLWLDADLAEPTTLAVAGGEAVVLASRTPQQSTADAAPRANEDAAAVLELDEHTAVIALADGMGGGNAGDRAAALAIQTLHDHVERAAGDPALLRSAILDAIEQANEAVLKLGIGAGTTLLIAELADGGVRTYHVGDSTCLLTGLRGKLKLQTINHSPVGFAVEAGQLNHDEALHHEDLHIVSNIVGTPSMRIEIGPWLPMATHDTLLLGSDGLFDNVHRSQIIETIRKGPLVAGVGALQRAAQQRMTDPAPGEPSKPDDLTIVAYRRRSV